MTRRPLWYILLISLCAALVACSGSNTAGKGSSAVTISIGAGSGPAATAAPATRKATVAITTLHFTISASDMQTISQSIAFIPPQTTATFDVPNGRARLFHVEAKDSNGVTIYEGSAQADLDGTPVTLDITLLPVVNPAVTSVTITISNLASLGAPPAGATLLFTITAPDMQPITRSISATASLTVAETFDVPNGTGRLFVVEGKDPDGRTVFRGSATADLSGAAVTIDIPLAPAVFTGTRLLGTAQDDFGNAVARDASGNIYLAGITHGVFGSSLTTGQTITANAFFAKFDQFGAPLLTRQFGTTNGTFAFALAVDGNQNIVVAGGTGGNLEGEVNHGFTDGFVTKYDPSGNRLWTKLVGDLGDDFVNAVAVDSSGNIYVTGAFGSTVPTTGNSDIFVVKYDPSGVELWRQIYGTAFADSGEAIALDAKGNVFVAGFTNGGLDNNLNANPDGTTSDAFVSKLDAATGITRLTVQIGTIDIDQAESIAVDAAGIIYIAGRTYGDLDGHLNTVPNGASSDMFVVLYDAALTKLLSGMLGTAGNDSINGLAVDAAGNVYAAGDTTGSFPGFTNAGGADSVVVKFSPTGAAAWIRQIGTPQDDIGRDVVADNAGNLFVVGETSGVFGGIQSSGFDAFLMMFDTNGVKQ